MLALLNLAVRVVLLVGLLHLQALEISIPPPIVTSTSPLTIAEAVLLCPECRQRLHQLSCPLFPLLLHLRAITLSWVGAMLICAVLISSRQLWSSDSSLAISQNLTMDPIRLLLLCPMQPKALFFPVYNPSWKNQYELICTLPATSLRV